MFKLGNLKIGIDKFDLLEISYRKSRKSMKIADLGLQGLGGHFYSKYAQKNSLTAP